MKTGHLSEEIYYSTTLLLDHEELHIQEVKSQDTSTDWALIEDTRLGLKQNGYRRACQKTANSENQQGGGNQTHEHAIV
jgi:hypothetical protein